MATDSDREPLTSNPRPSNFGSIDKSTENSPKDQKMAKNRFETWVMPVLAEFFGSLLFAFLHSLAAQSVPVIASAFTDGLFVTIMVIVIGPISGAHVNSAVTLGVALSGGMKWVMVPPYVIAQLLGSLAGAGLAAVAHGAPTGSFALGVGVNVGQGVLTEALLTILLVFAVLKAAVDEGSILAAFGIGLTIVIDIFVGARISGGCMNPSLSFGPAVVAGNWKNYWVYWVGPVVGSIIASTIYKLLLGGRDKRIFFNAEPKNDAAQDGGESTGF